MLQMFQRQIFWMSYLPLPKCKFATNLHHICYKQSSAHEKIIGMWEAVPTNISLVFYNIKVFWEQAASYQQWSRKFETHIPKETLLHKVSCKFVANALQSCKKQKATLVHLSTNIMNGTHAE